MKRPAGQPYRKGKGNPSQTALIVDSKAYDSDHKKSEKYRQYIMGRDFESFSWCIQKERWIKYGDNLAEPRYAAPYNDPKKIIVRQTADTLIAHLDDRKYLNLKNVHNIKATQKEYSLEYIVGVLNSSLMRWWYEKLVPEKGRTFAEVKAVNLRKVPIAPKQGDKKIIAAIADVVSKLLKTPDSSKLRVQLDDLVFKLFSVSDSQKKSVLKHFEVSKAA